MSFLKKKKIYYLEASENNQPQTRGAKILAKEKCAEVRSTFLLILPQGIC